MTADAKTKTTRQRGSWKQDPEAVKADILRVAREEFAAHGLSGARAQEIASRTKTSKRMIFYYFKDKENLYREVLEQAYRDVRTGEKALELENLDPVAALRKLVAYTFDHHRANEDFIRLVMIENIHRGSHVAESDTIRAGNSPVVEQLKEIVERGQQQGIFRDDIDPLQLHWKISAFCFFNVSNEATFSVIFGNEMTTQTGQDSLKADVVDTIVKSVLTTST
ncbi:TetR/AcrR family transcriptional regulator [Loktanella sp. S4079]|uniref:TetR/AcrR family transcriptional regulator n=1 Tax=Loktanella sp. S4079 TaxID=579483 RepID=UPI0005FA0076|nr:TetR/AcrR family transcriptional regulator [Loktanella sp. S4079]KJZ19049.1 TetR family transcriptional regulator [Loktanella sp. S4079]